ncbi:unnamed protein product [Moneuplotes crassus]|uniref:Uncharacterized protein n=1 Tax=Euplotes crassus TaxID=5936 RepID=A0AAD2D2U0_EUPCR|nr:unnamed protein product [Moneuplotes crassus]
MWARKNLIKLKLNSCFRCARVLPYQGYNLRVTPIQNNMHCLQKRDFSNLEQRKIEMLRGKKTQKVRRIALAYAGAAGLLIMSGSFQLIAIPVLIGSLHYLKVRGNLERPSTSYEMRKNKQFDTVFPDMLKNITECEELKPYFIEKDSIQIENPQFGETKHRMDNLFERYSFECSIADSITSAQAEVHGLLLLDILAKTVEFESLTVHLQEPIKERIRVISYSLSQPTRRR